MRSAKPSQDGKGSDPRRDLIQVEYWRPIRFPLLKEFGRARLYASGQSAPNERQGKAMAETVVRDSSFPVRSSDVGSYIQMLKREQCERILLALADLAAQGALCVRVTHEAIAPNVYARSKPGTVVRLHLTTEDDEEVFEGRSWNEDRAVATIDALSKAIPLSR